MKNVEAEIYQRRLEKQKFKGMLGAMIGIILAALAVALIK